MKQAAQLGTLSAINIALSFLFQWYALTLLGPGVETDALFAGMTVPQLALAVISGSLMHALIPLLAGESKERLRHDAWAFLCLVGALFGILAIVLYVFAFWWVPLTIPGFDAEGQALTVNLTQIQLIGMIFTAINGVQSAVYHAQQKFIWNEFSSILASGVTFLILIWALPRYGVIAAAWISTLRMGLQTFLLAPGMGWPVYPNFKSATIVQAWLRIKPLLFGTAYYKTDQLVDRLLLSSATAGSLSLYYLAQQIYNAANQVFNKAIATPLMPQLSNLHKAGDKNRFRSIYRIKLLETASLSLFVLLLLALFGQTILDLLVGYGNIDANNVLELWWIMLWLGGMFLGGALGQISSVSFYAYGNTKTPTKISAITYTAYIPCKVIAYSLLGIKGLAITTSIYYLINFFAQIFIFEINNNHGPTK